MTNPRRLHWSTGETRTYHGSRPDLLQARSLCGRWLWAEDLFAIWWQHTTCEHCLRMIAAGADVSKTGKRIPDRINLSN